VSILQIRFQTEQCALGKKEGGHGAASTDRIPIAVKVKTTAKLPAAAIACGDPYGPDRFLL
jgi:hypothetical protein